MLTNYEKCTFEIKSRIVMAKAAFNKKRALFTSTLDLKLRKKPAECYTWSIALYGAETWTLRTVDQKPMESFEMWWWRRMEKISWTDHVRNEEVLLNSIGSSRPIKTFKYFNLKIKFKSSGAKKYPTRNKKTEGEMDWSHFA